MRKSVSLFFDALIIRDVAGDLGEFTLTLLHNNDGKSELIDAGTGREDAGRVARFKTLPDRIRFHEMRYG